MIGALVAIDTDPSWDAVVRLSQNPDEQVRAWVATSLGFTQSKEAEDILKLLQKPEYPGRFPTIEGARAYFADFFRWFNEGHPHTALRMLTPSQVHAGEGREILDARMNARHATLARRRVYHLTGVEDAQPQTPVPACRAALPIRFRYPLPNPEVEASKAPDGPQITRQLLIN